MAQKLVNQGKTDTLYIFPPVAGQIKWANRLNPEFGCYIFRKYISVFPSVHLPSKI